MPATFTESDAVDMSKEKDWAFQIACMDWDKTQIVFTKRELLDFLSSVGVTVDSNLVKIQKLPRYAKFGKFSGETAPVASTKEAPGISGVEEPAPQASPTSASGGFKPTRRVRDAPGGKTSVFFGDDEEEPPVRKPAEPEEPETASPKQQQSEPRRRGGPSLGGVFGDDKPENSFKPTRRVRDNPGGEDHMHDIFS
ncbi:hypothetical protein M407DRAFT_244793 [Tulasnella calospora MUT 4182]|uniref:Uncharacterized protein n=1 Tax=Tulasnella calospora MUT 4182 TaxID=1051891 RepID=A0A0C3QEF2_9AGAM|nr:hypothetical protein M407DRAFT_244793 [Tulasnella calospora MUT 4182]